MRGVAGALAALLTMAALPCLACGDGAPEWTDAAAVLTASGEPGDADYGAYLSQECAACHLAEASGGVPPIDGIAPGYFREAMAEYASDARDNAAMASVARSLDDEQLAALAAHYALTYEED